jgi:hypothetical protein
MRSYVKLEGWDDESTIKLKELREKANLMNENPVVNSEGYTIRYYVVKRMSSKGDTVLEIQKRKYKKKKKIA